MWTAKRTGTLSTIGVRDVHLCPGMVGQLPYWFGHIAATAAMSYRRLHAHADVRALRNEWLRPRKANPST